MRLAPVGRRRPVVGRGDGASCAGGSQTTGSRAGRRYVLRRWVANDTAVAQSARTCDARGSEMISTTTPAQSDPPANPPQAHAHPNSEGRPVGSGREAERRLRLDRGGRRHAFRLRTTREDGVLGVQPHSERRQHRFARSCRPCSGYSWCEADKPEQHRQARADPVGSGLGSAAEQRATTTLSVVPFRVLVCDDKPDIDRDQHDPDQPRRRPQQ